MVDIDYEFNDDYFTYTIDADQLMETLIEFAETKMVKLDGKSSDLFGFFSTVFGNIDWEDVCWWQSEFGEFVHNKYEAEAKEAFEEEQLLDEE